MHNIGKDVRRAHQGVGGGVFDLDGRLGADLLEAVALDVVLADLDTQTKCTLIELV